LTQADKQCRWKYWTFYIETRITTLEVWEVHRLIP